MLLSGFTFIRNAEKYDFPIVECIQSMLPIVDELIVNVGNSSDETLALIKSLVALAPDKIKILESIWNDEQVKDGLVLSEQTNIALAACSGRWALYLQADECLHESELQKIRHEVEIEDGTSNPVEAIKFRYLHFYGGYNTIQHPWNWYPEEIRIVRKNSGALSFGDAQTFKKGGGHLELQTKTIEAHVFHYGHARAPEVMKNKIQYFHRFWHGDAHGKNTEQAYTPDLKELVWYWGTHPQVFLKRVTEGRFWSLRPGLVFKKSGAKQPFQNMVVYGSGLKAEALIAVLKEQFPRTKIYSVTSVWRWLRVALKCVGSRKHNVLIDLDAEKKPAHIFFCWIWDAIWIFKLRIANVPSGRLAGWKKLFYSFINWGKAEKEGAGFVVPAEFEISQILKWLGVQE